MWKAAVVCYYLHLPCPGAHGPSYAPLAGLPFYIKRKGKKSYSRNMNLKYPFRDPCLNLLLCICKHRGLSESACFALLLLNCKIEKSKLSRRWSCSEGFHLVSRETSYSVYMHVSTSGSFGLCLFESDEYVMGKMNGKIM